MNQVRNSRDLTMRQPPAGVGMCHKLQFMCHHKGARTGALFRGKLPMLCPACNAKGKP
jgi:hypothetical protein